MDIALVTKTEKRLLSASRMGIIFDYADGHRYIQFVNEDDVMEDSRSMLEFVKTQNVDGGRDWHKVYGTIIDALDKVDELLKEGGITSTLEEMYDYYNDWF